MQQQVVPIKYVGKKSYKTDNINHTKTVWKEPGDVQPYPLHLAASLLRHPDIWQLGTHTSVAGNAAFADAAGIVTVAPEPEQSAMASTLKNDTSRGPTLAEEAKAGPSAPKSKSARAME